MIACIRTVAVPEDVREPFLRWIRENRTVREAHGLLFELTGREGDTVVVTAWPSRQVFDAWIATPERDALTASEVHQSVDYRPIVRYDVVGGHVNLAGLSTQEDVR